MGVDLKYDLEEYSATVAQFVSLKDDIKEKKDNMIKSLETLRADWTTEGADAFFASIDDNWSVGIDNCVAVLEDLIDALNDAYIQYEKIETEANEKLKSM